MNPKVKTKHILPNSNLICFVIPSLFTKLECEKLLSAKIKNSFQKANSNYPTYYRNNERFVLDSDDLATYLFQKVKPYLPKTIEINSAIQSENGVWQLKELNNRLRFCKYSANQYFHRHLDGIHYVSETVQSKLTFMVYLNSATEFEGGRTLFFKTKETNEIWASYTPQQGDLIVFDHNVWHEGEILLEGEKFVLRSDILYSKKITDIKKQPFSGHLGYIWSLVKFDDSTILSGGRDKKIRVWNTLGEQKHLLEGHQNSILCIEKMNLTTFISGSRDTQIIVWKDYKIVNKIKLHDALVLSLCNLDATIFASSSGDKTIKIINLEGEVLKTLNEHKDWVWKVVKLDNDTIASCSEDKSIKIWNIKNENSIHTFYENEPIISLAFDSKTKKLVSGNLKGEISIRTLTEDYQQQTIKIIKAHKGIIRTIKLISTDYFATGAEDNKLKIWNSDGTLISEFEHHNFVQSIEVLDTKIGISCSYDGTIKTWNF